MQVSLQRITKEPERNEREDDATRAQYGMPVGATASRKEKSVKLRARRSRVKIIKLERNSRERRCGGEK